MCSKVLAGWMSDALSIPCHRSTIQANRTPSGTARPRFDGSVAGKSSNPPRGACKETRYSRLSIRWLSVVRNPARRIRTAGTFVQNMDGAVGRRQEE